MTRPRVWAMCVGHVGITGGHSVSGINGYCMRRVVGVALRIPRTNAGRRPRVCAGRIPRTNAGRRPRVCAGRIPRTNAGRVMTRPYPTRIAPHAHQPFPYHHDPMHVVRHHHEFMDIHMRHVLRYRIPTPLRPLTDGRWMHHAIRDPPEQMQPDLRANGHEIRTGLGYIVSFQTDGVPLRQFAGPERISALQVQMASS